MNEELEKAYKRIASLEKMLGRLCLAGHSLCMSHKCESCPVATLMVTGEYVEPFPHLRVNTERVKL